MHIVLLHLCDLSRYSENKQSQRKFNLNRIQFTLDTVEGKQMGRFIYSIKYKVHLIYS